VTRICRGKVLLCPSKLLPSEQSKHTDTHTNQKCLGDIPPWPNQKPTSVPAKGCDLVWAYLEELIQLHETPTNGIEHNELGWWVKKSISGVQHLFPPSFWKNIQQTAAWNHHPNELGMIKFQWFFGRNIYMCVCECVCVSVRWPYNPNKQLSQHESIWCPEKHTHKHIHLDTHLIYTTTLRAPCWPRAPHGPCWSDGTMAICARVVIWLAGGSQILLSKQASIKSCSAVLQLLLFKNLRCSKSSYI